MWPRIEPPAPPSPSTLPRIEPMSNPSVIGRRVVQRVGAGVGRCIVGEATDHQWHGLLDRSLGLGGIDAELRRDGLDAGRIQMAEYLAGQIADGNVLENTAERTCTRPLHIRLQACPRHAVT
jgi:hypothetical protein